VGGFCADKIDTELDMTNSCRTLLVYWFIYFQTDVNILGFSVRCTAYTGNFEMGREV
jgi:hypothetical protein